MNLKLYLDATYLKTAEQAEISDSQNKKIVISFIKEAIVEGFKLVMLRPNYVSLATEMIVNAKSKLLVGTVISFPEGTNSTNEKLEETRQAINNKADEIDIVCNYEAFKNGELILVKNEIIECTRLVLSNNKTIKWIIEVAALNNNQIIQFSALIKNVIMSNFKEDNYQYVFVKSSTGFYKTLNNLPNGATIPAIIMMLENASPLPVKAAGGIKNQQQALQLIQLGVKRIGTSAAKEIANALTTTSTY